ncbi:MAG: DMT family transporter [Rhodospirillaceae bacterium]|nr:DMT family transporter [Rhodospirillaceae bacterium]MBT5458851.1 DMT family transporter [Rhodospirillaceae bacterium]
MAESKFCYKALVTTGEYRITVRLSATLSRATERWSRLSGNIRGILWISVGTVLFALTDVVVKTLGRTFHPFELGLFRYAIGFLMLVPVFIRMGPSQLKTKRIGLHLTRLVMATIAQLGIFVSIINMKLADATAIMFSKPLFTTVVAVFILSELVAARRWAATAIGFLGVIIMMRPGSGAIDPVALIAVAAALTFAVANILIRLMSTTEPPSRILFYYHIGGMAILIGPALWVWRMPAGIEWGLLALIGILTTLAMICFVRAYSVGEANAVGPIEYIRLIYAGLLGYFIFSETLDMWTLLGGTIIVGSTLFIARDEARRAGGQSGPAG